MKLDNESLLIDRVYHSCFDKGRPRPALRAMLERARRFVLDDEMSRFLADLNFQTFTGRYLPIKPHRRRIHFCRGIDTVRHFARLPHKVTWIELSEDCLLRRMREIARDIDDPATPIFGPRDPNEPMARSRLGWLCWQHEKIDTAFSARLWSTNNDGATGSIPIAIMWDTEDGVLPWRQMSWLEPSLAAPSEWLLLAPGYVRDNVGFCNVSGQLDTPLRDPRDPVLLQAQHSLGGRLQALWTFLSTLNKIPLAGERKVERSHGFMARARYRRFLDHTIITLTIPGKADPRKIARQVTNELRRRAHQVRGHWRDDWRQPKGNKALWIPEHQRGDASLGFVTHDYAVHHDRSKTR